MIKLLLLKLKHKDRADYLVAKSQLLGTKIDKLRANRALIKAELDNLLSERYTRK